MICNRSKLFLFSLLFLPFVLQAQYRVYTYAGTGQPGSVNGIRNKAKFRTPFGICADKHGNIFIADNGNNCIRKIDSLGMVSIYAGSTSAGYADGPSAQARFKAPTGVCVDDSGNVYVSDFENQRIRKINALGIVSTIAGSGTAGYKEGQGTTAQFNFPRGICRDKKGNLYVGDSWNHRVRKITPAGLVSSYAGGGDTVGVQTVGHYKDAADTAARFYTPCEVKIDAAGNIYVADAYTHRIRKIDTNRIVTTVAGSGDIGQSTGGFQDGAADVARFNVPTSLFWDESDSSIYLGDGINQRVRKIKDDQVSTFAGTGDGGFDNGPTDSATFDFPRGITADGKGGFYVIDFNNHSIRLISEQAPVLGIHSGESFPDFRLYPNPAQDKVKLLGVPSDARITLYSSLGQLLLEEKNVSTINLSTFPQGSYILRISNAQGSSHRNLIITR